MEMVHCPNCNSLRGFKRALGFGTLFMVVITCGLWLLVIPLYPERCITCGLAHSSAKMKTCRCGQQIASNAQSCPHCGHRPNVKFLAWCLAAVIVLGIVASMSRQTGKTIDEVKTQPTGLVSITQNAPNSLNQGYSRAAMEYLSSANAGGTRLATIWAESSNNANGTLALDGCRIATRKALSEENARYSTYRATRGTVPPAFVDVDKHIGGIHKKSTAALSSILSYWTNGHLHSISQGMDQYRAAILEMNSAITAVTKDEAR
jgi:hypothetical protein